MRLRAFAALALLLMLATATAQSEDAARRAAEEKQAKQKLDQIRAEIKALTEQQHATSGERSDATRALREQELAIAAAIKELRALDEKLVGQQAELVKLEQRRGELAIALDAQREALGALLRSAYALGRSEELKLLLQQEDVGTIARVLAYHRYFQQARIDRIDGLLGDLKQLADVQLAIEAQNTELNATRARREEDVRHLETQRSEREKLLVDLDLKLKDQQSRLAAMGKDEKGLIDLLEKLRDVFADIPKQLSGAEPFASLRGQLAWPLHGKIRTNFGGTDEAGRRISGVLIAGESGSPVQAIARGRVAYADWLKGYGMLLIIDHGDGYMSLYGYNESLRKDVGDWVAPGETIATSGASGGQKTPALYFELRHQGKPLDPKPWLR
jgi:septal ring factor EnvC (AmiA/AmiB activator)